MPQDPQAIGQDFVDPIWIDGYEIFKNPAEIGKVSIRLEKVVLDLILKFMERQREIVDANTLVHDVEDPWRSGLVDITDDDAAFERQKDLGGHLQHAISVRAINAESVCRLVRAVVQAAMDHFDYGLLRVAEGLLSSSAVVTKDAVDERLVAVEADRGRAVADRGPQRPIARRPHECALQGDVRFGSKRNDQNRRVSGSDLLG